MPTADHRQPPTAQWLTDRYLTDRLTAEEIGELCGWSSQYIRDRLRDHGIPLRPPGTHRRIRRTLDRDTLASWLHDGATVQQISNRSGYTTSGIYNLLHQHQLTVPEPPPRPPATQDPLIAELVRLYQDEHLSLAVIGQRYNHDPDWVKARLHRAGIPLRAPGRQAVVDPQRVRDLLDEGLRVPEIADTIGCSTTTVQAILRAQGWTAPPRRPRGPNRVRPPQPDSTQLRRLYLEQKLSVNTIADQLGLPPHRIRTALQAAGIPVHKPGWTAGQPPPPITHEQLQQLYVEQRLSTRQVADELGCGPTRVLAALRRHHIPIRTERPTVPSLDVDEPTLRELYVTQHLDDQTIGAELGVPAWRVTMRRRELGIRRPAGRPPHKTPPAPPDPEVLARLYIDEGHTLEDIAHQHHTSSPVVRDMAQRRRDPRATAHRPRTPQTPRPRPDRRALPRPRMDLTGNRGPPEHHRQPDTAHPARPRHSRPPRRTTRTPANRGRHRPTAHRPLRRPRDHRAPPPPPDPPTQLPRHHHRTFPDRRSPSPKRSSVAPTSTSASPPRTSNSSPDNPPAKSPITSATTTSPSDHPAARLGSNANNTAETDQHDTISIACKRYCLRVISWE